MMRTGAGISKRACAFWRTIPQRTTLWLMLSRSGVIIQQINSWNMTTLRTYWSRALSASRFLIGSCYICSTRTNTFWESSWDSGRFIIVRGDIPKFQTLIFRYRIWSNWWKKQVWKRLFAKMNGRVWNWNISKWFLVF